MLAAAFVRGDFESGSDSKSGLFVAEVCTHILGQCPLTFAAAFVRGDFESGSDSKSGLFVVEVCAHIDVHRVGQRLDVLSFFVFLFYTVNSILPLEESLSHSGSRAWSDCCRAFSWASSLENTSK